MIMKIDQSNTDQTADFYQTLSLIQSYTFLLREALSVCKKSATKCNLVSCIYDANFPFFGNSYLASLKQNAKS